MSIVSSYPLCAKRLAFQKANLSEPSMTKYWAAVAVASEIPDVRLTAFGGFDFNDMSEKNGGKLLSRLEMFLRQRSQNVAANSVFASEGLKAMLGSRGIKTSCLESEDDYWAAAGILFPERIKRDGGLSSLYVQINSIPKKERKRLAQENLRLIPPDWLSTAEVHRAKITA